MSLYSVDAPSSAGESFLRHSSFRDENTHFPAISEYAESVMEDCTAVPPIYARITADVSTYTDIKQLSFLGVKTFPALHLREIPCGFVAGAKTF